MSSTKNSLERSVDSAIDIILAADIPNSEKTRIVRLLRLLATHEMQNQQLNMAIMQIMDQEHPEGLVISVDTRKSFEAHVLSNQVPLITLKNADNPAATEVPEDGSNPILITASWHKPGEVK